MKLSSSTTTPALLVLLGVAALLFTKNSCCNAQQLTNDPPSYFGGVNHQSYLDWMRDNHIEAKYNSSIYLPSMDKSSGAAVHWKADDEYFYVAVVARSAGWVGFGLSETGGMLGSDMALFTASRPNELVDAYVVDQHYPKRDECQHDWILVNSSSSSDVSLSSVAVNREDATTGNDFLMFEARRKLHTGDPQDIPLIHDNIAAVPEQRIIAAWGDTPEVGYHGTNVARGSIRVFQAEVDEADFDQSMAMHADGSFFVGAENYLIPGNDTTYEDFCFTRADLIAQGVPNVTNTMSIIGFRPVVDDGPSAPMIHHYVVTGFFNSSDDACSGNEGGVDLVYVWAPGAAPLALPGFLGGNLLGDEGFQGFNVEIHYNNPRLVEGVVDSSGVEFYYSTTKREVEMAVLQVGDPFVRLRGQKVGEGYNLHSFECPGSCSDTYLATTNDEPVTVLREHLHMHMTGARMANEQIRNGEVIRTATIDVFDFNQNGNIAVKQDPYQILPGDSFRTSCYYNGNQDTIFGLSSSDEMCIAFLYYYPRKVVTLPTPQGNFSIPWICGLGMDWMNNTCNAAHSGAVLESSGDLDRQFGKQKAECLLEPPIDIDVDADVNEDDKPEDPTAVAETTAPDSAGASPLNEAPVPEFMGEMIAEERPVSGAAFACMVSINLAVAMLFTFVVL